MKTRILLLMTIISLLMIVKTYPQSGVAINETGTAPAASAMLDVRSTTKGLLIPRMNDTQMSGIVSPATGLMIYNTSCNCFYFRQSSGWKKIIDETGNNAITDGDLDSYLSLMYQGSHDDSLYIIFQNTEK